MDDTLFRALLMPVFAILASAAMIGIGLIVSHFQRRRHRTD
jgi:predicted permease